VARRFKSNDKVKDAVKQWSNGLAAEVYDKGTQKLITRYHKCLNAGDDYVENNLRVRNNDTLFYCLFFLIANGLYCLHDPCIVLLCPTKYFLTICNFFKAQVITLSHINLYTT